jgi:hypothetical protein
MLVGVHRTLQVAAREDHPATLAGLAGGRGSCTQTPLGVFLIPFVKFSIQHTLSGVRRTLRPAAAQASHISSASASGPPNGLSAWI